MPGRPRAEQEPREGRMGLRLHHPVQVDPRLDRQPAPAQADLGLPLQPAARGVALERGLIGRGGRRARRSRERRRLGRGFRARVLADRRARCGFRIGAASAGMVAVGGRRGAGSLSGFGSRRAPTRQRRHQLGDRVPEAGLPGGEAAPAARRPHGAAPGAVRRGSRTTKPMASRKSPATRRRPPRRCRRRDRRGPGRRSPSRYRRR